TQGNISPSKIKKLKNKKSKLSRPKKLRMYVPEAKPEISPSDLLKTDKNILLVGKPGIGKTALLHEMLKLWAERDKELDYMFYFDMREISNSITRLEDLLFCAFSESDEGKEEVLQDMKRNSDNVTIIFDGVTDRSPSVVKKLLKKELFPDAKLIVTCRPDDEEEVFLSGDFVRVEVKGFSEQTIKTYLSALLGHEQEKVLSNVELLTLCHVPMYALMVAACFSFETPEDSPQLCSITEIYINIFRFCLQTNSNRPKHKLNSFIKNKTEEILSLAEAAFNATKTKTVNLTEVPCEDSCVLSFLKPLFIKVAPKKTITTYAFLHYTVQEFFAALWLLKNPDEIKEVFQQCLTEEKKHMKHLIPFMCRLLTEKKPSLMTCLISAQELKNTSDWFFQELMTTFCPCLSGKDDSDSEDIWLDVDILFLCQCFYESQCPEACSYFLDKLDYHLDLSGESLDAFPCCAVAYVVTQSKERKIQLSLEDVTVSEQGMRRLFGCLKNVQCHQNLQKKSGSFVNLFYAAAEREQQTGEKILELLSSRCTYQTFPLKEKWCDFLQTGEKILDLYSYETETGLSVLPSLQSVFQSAPSVWFINLSERKTSILLEVLKLQPEKKQVKLTGCSDEESEVRSLLQCLPYISQLSFSQWLPGRTRFTVNLFCAAAEREQQTGEKILELLSSRCTYQTFPLIDRNMSDLDKEYQSGFLLDLYSHMKDRERLKQQKSKSEVQPALMRDLKFNEILFRTHMYKKEEIRFFVNLFCAAAEREQTGEKIESISSV
ncbi:hypothetical protein L3Q82_009991, partial [Scortum barcoo]